MPTMCDKTYKYTAVASVPHGAIVSGVIRAPNEMRARVNVQLLHGDMAIHAVDIDLEPVHQPVARSEKAPGF